MPRRTYEVKTHVYGGLDLIVKTSEVLFETAIETMNDWKKNLDDGLGAKGSHEGAYRDRGEAVNDITLTPQFEGAQEYVVGGNVVQLFIAEYGRAPGTMPPFQPIADWARRKGITSIAQDGPEFFFIVNAIRKKIAQEGLEGFAPGLGAANANNRRLKKKLKTLVEDSIIRD